MRVEGRAAAAALAREEDVGTTLVWQVFNHKGRTRRCTNDATNNITGDADQQPSLQLLRPHKKMLYLHLNVIWYQPSPPYPRQYPS